jgi:hypothetical protein
METEFETLELNSMANWFKVLEAEIISLTDQIPVVPVTALQDII